MDNPFLKIYRLSQLATSYKLKLLRPLGPPCQFGIEATNRCNFKCHFCPQSNNDHKNVRPVGNLSIEDFRSFIKNIKYTNCGNSNISICLDGEPTLNKNFPEFIKISNEEGFFPRFSSNGMLLTRELVDKLSPYKYLASVDFSSDSSVFDNIRGYKGSFYSVLKNVKYLVSTATTARQIKIEIVDITHFPNNPGNANSLVKMKRLFSADDLPSNIAFWSREFHNFCGHLDTRYDRLISRRYKLCPYPWSSFSVTWDGNVVACCRDTAGRTILGNAFETSIRDIWYEEKYVSLRKALVEKRVNEVAACSECDMPYSSSSGRWRIKYLLSSLLRR